MLSGLREVWTGPCDLAIDGQPQPFLITNGMGGDHPAGGAFVLSTHLGK